METTLRALMAVAMAAVPLAGLSAGPEAAFRAADAVVVAPDAFFGARGYHSVAAWGGGAMDDLTNALSKVTGSPIALFRESAPPRNAKAVIYLGDTAAARAAGVADASIRNLGFRVKAECGRAFIWSRTPTGASYGMTDFLARFAGYRMLTMSGDDPYRVDRGLEIPVCDYRDEPVIYRRDVWSGATPSKRTRPKTRNYWWDGSGYARRLRIRFREGDIEGSERVSQMTPNCHSAFSYVPPKKYWKDHPEYYSMDENGNRYCVDAKSRSRCGQLCMTNPDVRRICTESLLAFAAEDRRIAPGDYPCIYDLTQMDGSSWFCYCPRCREVIAAHNAVPGGHKEGGDTWLQMDFVNHVAREAAKVYPDIRVRTFAYVNTDFVPPGLRIEPNVVVWLCDLYMYSDHMRPLASDFNRPRREKVEEWFRVAPAMELWDYVLNNTHFSRGRTFPELCVDAVASDARYFHSLGLKRLFVEEEYTDQPLYELDAYVQGRCYWDPSCDVERLVDEYCTVYGRAAGEMRKAIDLLRGAIAGNPPATCGLWFNRNLAWRSTAFYDKFRLHLAAAYSLAELPVERARIAKVLASTDAELMHLRGASAEERAKRRLDEENNLRFAVEDLTSEISDPAERESVARELAEALVARREIDGLAFNDMPPGVTNVAGDVYCFDLRSIEAKGIERQVDDPAAFRGKAIEMCEKNSVTPMACGFYDFSSCAAENFSVDIPKADGAPYRWFRAGCGVLSPKSVLWFPASWQCSVPLTRCYASADGAEIDPNRFEVWFSAAWRGGRLRVDRVVLARKAR